MRGVSRFGFVLALGLVLMAGCSDVNGERGSGGTGGSTAQVFPCTEQGIRDAIALGGGPHTFDCDATTTVTVDDRGFVIDKDVILEGQSRLRVEGALFYVSTGVTAALRGLTSSNGEGINNDGALTLANCMVSDSEGPLSDLGNDSALTNRGRMTVTNCTITRNSGLYGGIYNSGAMDLLNSTISDNDLGGIYNTGTLTMSNSTASGNLEWSIVNEGTASLTSCTVSGGGAGSSDSDEVIRSDGPLTIEGSVIDGECAGWRPPDSSAQISSLHHNVESPRDTCGFDQPTDQVNVTVEQLNLGPLQDNGGPTMTHALGAGSVAIDQIPEADCVDADGLPLTTDQRGFTRPVAIVGAELKCDIGAFEVQP